MKLNPILSYTLLALTMLVLAATQSNAQTGTLRGSIYEKETGEPVIFTNVYLKGTTYGSASDINGLYVISKIPVGQYTLMVTYLGYDTLSMLVNIKEDEIITQNLYLQQASLMLQEVSISAERQEARTETKTAVTKVTGTAGSAGCCFYG